MRVHLPWWEGWIILYHPHHHTYRKLHNSVYLDRASVVASSGGCIQTDSRHPSKQQRPHHEEQQRANSSRHSPSIARTLARASMPRGGVAAAHFGWLLD